MEIPQDLGQWTYETVLGILQHHDYEPGRFEYKEVLIPSAPASAPAPEKHKENIRKAACSMANTEGGYILFGVKDRAAEPASEKRVPGIPTSDDSPRYFGDLMQKIRPGLRFDCSPRAIPVSGAPGRGVFVVQIERSPVRPHELDGIFYRRGDGGQAVTMAATEVRNLMLLSEGRFSKLTLLRIELRQVRTVAQIITEADVESCPYRFQTGAVNPLLAETCSLFPPGNRLLINVIAMVTMTVASNGLLDRMNHEYALGIQSVVLPNITGMWKVELDSFLRNIAQVCDEAEKSLAKVYGPVLP